MCLGHGQAANQLAATVSSGGVEPLANHPACFQATVLQTATGNTAQNAQLAEAGLEPACPATERYVLSVGRLPFRHSALQ
jgi:hypothetical protein